MKKPTKGPKPAKVIPGGPMKRPAPAAKVIPGGPMKAPAPAAAKVYPGSPMRAPAPRKKPAPKKKPAPRKLSPGGNCVAGACHALTGHRPAAGEDGLFIPAALEALAVLGLIAGFAPVDLEEVMSHEPSDSRPRHLRETRAGLILGLDLPGPHAVLTVPGGLWWSWDALYDPAVFPDAVIEEAWAVNW